ncbi:MAG TPA: ABC transporter ATP-binding protein [Herpetosiphonaceae bacterium]
MIEAPLLEIQALHVRFGGLVALQELSLRVDAGEIIGLIGPNGAGKTTVFNCISRFYAPSSGAIRCGGRDLGRAAPHEVIGYGIARTFQNVELCPSMTALDNLLLGQHALDRGRAPGGWLADALGLGRARRREAAARDWADSVLRSLELFPYRDRVVSTLPFGVQKAIELARAVVARPRLILLDEPAAGADPAETAAIAGLIRRLRAEFGLSFLLVEHDMPLVMGLCDRLYVLDFGRLIAQGAPAAIRADPAVQAAYLGSRASGRPAAAGAGPPAGLTPDDL